MSYNPIDAKHLTAALEKHGFEPTVVGKELVYTRDNHNDPQLTVKVYTSVTEGHEFVKKKGSDAIRTCLVYTGPDGKTRGVAKTKRVHRSGTDTAIIKRMMERARAMYKLANQMATGGRCKCGGPCWPDSGKCVVCYSKEKAKPAPEPGPDFDPEQAEVNFELAQMAKKKSKSVPKPKPAKKAKPKMLPVPCCANCGADLGDQVWKQARILAMAMYEELAKKRFEEEK